MGSFALLVATLGTLGMGCIGNIDAGENTGDLGVAPGIDDSAGTGGARVGGGTDKGGTAARIPAMGTPPGGAGTEGAPAGAGACQPGALVSTALRRLTRREYDNTIAALLGDTSAPAKGFAPESGTTGFDNAADGATLSEVIAEQYVEASRALAEKAVKNLGGLLACDVATLGEDSCTKRFIGRFGRRAFRRPLTADEQARYEGLYTSGKTSYGFAAAVELVLRSFLTAPQFLYKVELGAGAGPKPGTIKLSPYEMAARLSYFFWGTTPDDDLLSAADSGRLATPQQVEAQAQRLFDHADGGRVIRDFYDQWLQSEKLETVQRGPSYTPALVAAMKQETELYFDRLVRERGASWQELLQSPITFVNADLAAHYGLPGVTGSQFREILRPRDRHRGFLTQGAFLTLHAFPENDPKIAILRGKFLRTHIMCESDRAVPADIDPLVPPADASKTGRQQLEAKTQMVQPCQTCHDWLNPPGFAFGKFDQIGRWNETDLFQRPIDTTGTLRDTDVDGPFQGHLDLVDRLARSERAASCVVTQWFRYATAQMEKPGDCGRHKELIDAFKAAGGNVRALVLMLVSSDAFLYKGVTP